MFLMKSLNKTQSKLRAQEINADENIYVNAAHCIYGDR